MYLFLDTETSDPVAQRVVQLSAILTDKDGNELEVLDHLIYPDGWYICDRFVGYHGITQQMCYDQGVPMLQVLAKLNLMLVKTKLIICHNFTFDSSRVLNEFNIYTIPSPFTKMAGFCTMKEGTPICQLPASRGSGYKWPKLQEIHKHYFGAEFEGDHNALYDARATKRVFFAMRPPVPENLPVVESAKPPEADDFSSENIIKI